MVLFVFRVMSVPSLSCRSLVFRCTRVELYVRAVMEWVACTCLSPNCRSIHSQHPVISNVLIAINVGIDVAWRWLFRLRKKRRHICVGCSYNQCILVIKRVGVRRRNQGCHWLLNVCKRREMDITGQALLVWRLTCAPSHSWNFSEKN